MPLPPLLPPPFYSPSFTTPYPLHYFSVHTSLGRLYLNFFHFPLATVLSLLISLSLFLHPLSMSTLLIHLHPPPFHHSSLSPSLPSSLPFPLALSLFLLLLPLLFSPFPYLISTRHLLELSFADTLACPHNSSSDHTPALEGEGGGGEWRGKARGEGEERIEGGSDRGDRGERGKEERRMGAKGTGRRMRERREVRGEERRGGTKE